MKPLTYLAAPYSHPDPAVREARFKEINHHASDLMRSGVKVFSPISHTHPIALAGGLPTGFDYWEEYDDAILSLCHNMIVLKLEGWEDSKGVAGEIKIATKHKIPISYREPYCPTCGGAGGLDSGGVTPWGAGIDVPCPACNPPQKQMRKLKIYVASSWRNGQQPSVVKLLRESGFEVYDFRNPKPDDYGFHWSEIDLAWKSWDAQQYRNALLHPLAESGFASDWNAMEWADACVLVLPCGRSAHIEAGYFVGAKKPLVILLSGEDEPELMYKMTPFICLDRSAVVDALKLVSLAVP